MEIVKVCLAKTFAFRLATTQNTDAMAQQFKDLAKTSNVYLYQQEVKGSHKYESELSLKASVPVHTFEDKLLVEMVDVYLGGLLEKLATQFNLNELDIVTVAQVAWPPELIRMLAVDHGIKRSLVDPCSSPLAVMVGLVLSGYSDTTVHELLPALVDYRDAQMLKKVEAEVSLLEILEWCWTKIPFPPFPFPGR